MLITMLAGLYLGYCFFRPAIPLSIIHQQPQPWADRWIYVEGRVNRVFGIDKFFKAFELCDPADGACLLVKTDRSILPAPNTFVRIRVKPSEPLAGYICLVETQRAWWNFLVLPGNW